MDFFLSGLWWGLFIATSIAFLVYTVARRNWEPQIVWLNTLGGWCALFTIVVLIVAFVLIGWRGGLAIMGGMVLVALAGILITHQIFKGRPKRRHGIKIPTSAKELEEWAEEEDKRMEVIVTWISKQPKIIEVLERYERTPEYVKDIHEKLLLGKAGIYVADSVIQNPDLLSQYLQMESDGVVPEVLAFTLLKLLKRK